MAKFLANFLSHIGFGNFTEGYLFAFLFRVGTQIVVGLRLSYSSVNDMFIHDFTAKLAVLLRVLSGRLVLLEGGRRDQERVLLVRGLPVSIRLC